MKRATIDIGSNSVLLLAGTMENGLLTEVLNESRITSLGKNLDIAKMFNPESMEATFTALKDYKTLLESNGFLVAQTIVTATEASRVAKNAEDFFQKIKNELGFKIIKITAEGEAYYTALGVVSSLSKNQQNTVVVLDIGGASSELIKIQLHPFQILSTISLPIGSVRATDWINDGSIDTKWHEIALKFSMNDYETKQLICVAGSMTSLGAIYFKLPVFDAEALEGKVVGKNNFHQFLSSLLKIQPNDLLAQYPYLGKRVNSISGGVWVANKIVERVCQTELLISTRGLRYGTFISGGIDEQYTY